MARLSIVLLLILAASGCGEDSRVQLVQADTEREANRIVVALVESGVGSGEIQRTTEQRKPVFRIYVDQQDLNRARAILVENDLPRPEESGFDKMLSNTGLIPTAGDEQARLMFATASELQRTLETFDSVVTARVHIVMPGNDPLSDQKSNTPSATVLLKRRSDSGSTTRPAAEGAEGSPASDDEVRRLVAGAVPNLKPEDVRVIWTTATRREIPNIKPPTSKNPEPTVLALSGVVALLLLTLIGVTLQLVKANRQLNRGGNRLATNLSR